MLQFCTRTNPFFFSYVKMIEGWETKEVEKFRKRTEEIAEFFCTFYLKYESSDQIQLFRSIVADVTQNFYNHRIHEISNQSAEFKNSANALPTSWILQKNL